MIEIALSALWEVTLSASALILLLLAFRQVFKRKISPRWQYCVWALVLLRLAVPVTVESAFSVMNAVAPATERVEQALAPVGQFVLPPQNANTYVPQTDFMLTESSIQAAQPTVAPRQVSWQAVVFYGWLAGIAATLSLMVVVNIGFFRKLKKTELPLPAEMAELFKSFGLRGRIPVYISETVASPCLIGWFRPCIVVTHEAVQRESRLRHVLLHELCHLRQRDNWIALLRNVTCAVYWFNPLVWLAAVVSRRDCELSCDAAAMGRLKPYERLAYGETLISLIRRPSRSGLAALQTATTMAAGKRAMKERIGMIAKRPKMLRVTAALAAVAIAAIALAACTGALTDEPAAASTPSPTPAATPAATPISTPAPAATFFPATNEDYIEKLDKQSDNQISDAYDLRPEGFAVAAVYDGTFSGSGKAEKLAIIKAADQPHVGGLDAHIAAVYDAETLENLSAMYFATDNFAYHVHTAADGRGYFMYSGFYSNTGLYEYDFAFYQMGSPWTKLHEVTDEQSHTVLGANGVATVYTSLLETQHRISSHMVMLAERHYTLTFNPQTISLETEYFPAERRDAIYADLDNDFHLTIPASLSGQYHLEFDGNANGTVSFVQTASKDVLFSLLTVPASEERNTDRYIKGFSSENGSFILVLRPYSASDVAEIADSVRWGNAMDAGLISMPSSPYALPEAGENGSRSYRWNNQLVEDWLGDTAEAAAIRNLLLPMLNGFEKEDFYYIYLGRMYSLSPSDVLVPAGKRHDGEWMPDIYHIAKNAVGEWQVKSYSYNYAWQITRSQFSTSIGEVTTYLGIPEVSSSNWQTGEQRDFPLEVTLHFTDGSVAADTIPYGTNYFLITHEHEKTLYDIQAANANTGQIFPWETFESRSWQKHEGEERTLALYANIISVPSHSIGNSLSWNELPTLDVVPRTELHRRGGSIYAANISDGERSFNATAPAPLSEIFIENHGIIPATMHRYDELMTFTIDYKAFGRPEKVVAELYNSPTDFIELEYAHYPEADAWQIRTPVLTPGEWYMISVKADFGNGGYMHWVLPMMR